MTLQAACEAYLRDLEARKLSRSTRNNYRSLFRAWQAWAAERCLSALRDFNQAEMRAWRESWDCSPGTHALHLRLLRAFFNFTVRAGWLSASPAANLRAPKQNATPNMPLAQGEVQALLTAAEETPKERALILLMRYSGLAIRDAVTLSREAIDRAGHLTLRRAKSGELVMVRLPVPVLEALGRFSPVSERHYFWRGAGLPETATKYWRRRLYRVADRAGVEGFRPHRLRDTFAVELLAAGVVIDDVKTLLGHSSVKTTEKFYAQWNLPQRDRLVAITQKAHKRDPVLQALGRTRKNVAGTETTGPRNNSPARTDNEKSTGRVREAYHKL